MLATPVYKLISNSKKSQTSFGRNSVWSCKQVILEDPFLKKKYINKQETQALRNDPRSLDMINLDEGKLEGPWKKNEENLHVERLQGKSPWNTVKLR